MINRISGWISYKLFEKGIITEEEFRSYDYIIGMIMFGFISTSSFVLIGYILGHLNPMLISMLCFWSILQIMNYKSNVHSKTFLGCGFITTTHLLIAMYGSLYLQKIIPFNNCLFVYSSIISVLTVGFMVSKTGTNSLRWIEKNIFIWDKN